MTDNEIIKALECCTIKTDCKGCYFDTHEAEDICAREVVKNAFDLITRQQAEIERLNAENMLTMSERNAFRTSFYEVSKQLKTAKSESVKEFAERLKDNLQWDSEYDNKFVFENDIDVLVKEVVGNT